MSFPLDLRLEESLFEGGYQYDVIHHIRSGYTRIMCGRSYHLATSIKSAHRTIKWLKDCGNTGDFEIREHIWPWDSLWTKIRKRLFGRIYYDSELKRTKNEHDTELLRLKKKYG